MKWKFTNKWIYFVSRQISLPNGRRIQKEYVQHPNAVLIIPFLNSDKLVFIRQYRPVVKSYLYELPAGTLERGEKPVLCARRELKEETGYRARKLSSVGWFYLAPGYSTEKIFLYRAGQLSQEQSAPDSEEVIQTVIFTKNQVRKLFARGKIRDSKTISALVYCRWL